MAWLALSAAVAVFSLTVGFIGHSLWTGRISFQGRHRASRSATPLAFVIWVAMALVWGSTIICLALPLIVS